MASARAVRLCPDLVFRKPRFEVYRHVSETIRAIFADYTELVEPLSLDEACLDVTADLRGIGSATRAAELIRARIRAETGLTASAGVSYNKFLAKLASDHNKPDGLCVIRPGEGAAFVAAVPVRRFHGVGPRGAEKMAALGIVSGADLAAKDLAFLEAHFGVMGGYLYRAARSVDLRPVRAHRQRKSVSAERTFAQDLSSGSALRDALNGIVEIAWQRIERSGARGRSITLKLRYSDFTQQTRARTLTHAVADRGEFAQVARDLLDRLLPLPQPVRLLGLGMGAIEGEGGESGGRDEAVAVQAKLPLS